MTETALFEAGFRRWEMLWAAWNFYLILSLTLIIAFAALPALRTNRRVYWIFTVGYAGFAWAHLLGLLYILKQWRAIAEELRFMLERSQPVERYQELLTRFEASGVLDAPEGFWVVPFHLVGDLFVLGALWWLRRD